MATMLRMTGVASEVSRGLPSPAGVGSGHVLWVGRSGRRHVFSRLEAEDRDDVGGAVLLVVRRTEEGEPLAERLVVAAEQSPGADGCEIWVHWLAETEAERLAVIADLEFRPSNGDASSGLSNEPVGGARILRGARSPETRISQRAA